MKHIFIISGIFLTLNYSSIGQSETENIAMEICVELQNVNLKKDIESVNKKSQELIQETFLKKQDLIQLLQKQYAKENPDKSEVEISKIIGQDIVFYLMKDCEYFQRITMFKNGPIPIISSTTEKVGQDFTELLIQRIKTDPISQIIVDECMVKSMDINENEIIGKYGSKYSYEFVKEFQAYLLTKCEPYMRWTASMIN